MKNNKIRGINFKLLYRASCDSDFSNTFFELCGKDKYILLIIKTTKGNIFGAYTYLYYNNDNPHSDQFFFDAKKIH